MHRLKSLVAGAVLVMAPTALAACGGQAARPSSSAPGKHAPVPFTVAVAAMSAPYGPYLTAQDKGYYKAAGLDVKFEKMTGSLATQALISGGIQASTSGTTAMVAIMKGAKLREVFTGEDRPPYFLVAAGSVHGPANLRGRKVAIEARGDSGELATDLFLEKYGLKPTSVTFIPVGYGAPNRLAALKSGAVAAAPLMNLDVNKIQKQIQAHKYTVLGNYSKSVPLQLTGAATSLQEIRTHPDLVQAFVTATIQGALYFQSHRAYGVALLMKHNPSVNRADALVNYNQVVPLSTRDGIGTAAARANTIHAIAEYLKVAPLPAKDIYDDTFAKAAVKRLKAEGWKP